MALTKNQRMVLDKISGDFSGLVSPADSSKGAIKGRIDNATTKMKTMTFSSPSTLATAIADYSSDVSNRLPGNTESDIQEILSMIGDCDFLNGQSDDNFSTMMKVINNAVKSIFDNIGTIAFDFSVTIPEFDAGGLLDYVNSLFGGLSFPNFPSIKIPGQIDLTNIMKNADKLINCLDILGEGEYNDQVTEDTSTLTNLFDDLSMVSNPVDPNYGNLDLASIYSTAGISSPQQANMNAMQGAFRAVKEASVGSVSQALDKAKSMKKLGII